MVHLSVVFITRKYLYQGNFHPVSQIKKAVYSISDNLHSQYSKKKARGLSAIDET
jgi:hypothetical protein